MEGGINKNTISITIKLNNGIEMPRIGLGTNKVQNLSEIVYQSIKDGLRMIDTASRYENEKEVGEGIARAINEKIITREELFVVTKLWITHKADPEAAIKRQLKELNLSYVDLYLDHFPCSIYKVDGKVVKTPIHILWKNMENLVKKGYTKSIGVSNYKVQTLMDLLSYCEIKPVVNQIEFHPYLNETNLYKYCMENQIIVTAYNSMTKGDYVKFHSHKNLNLLNEPIIISTAEKYNTTAGNICLNWALSQDVIVIPATSNPNRMKENLTALNFRLTEEDLNTINEKLNRIHYRFNPTTQWDFSMGYDLFA
jgi:D-xylose reductase